VRNFTTMSEALGARETVSMLNEYFERMVDVVLTTRACSTSSSATPVMALFGVPFNGEHDADDAVKVANAMFVALRVLNQERHTQGKAPIGIGVGISTGIVVVGNIGSTKRMEYTAIGDSVNLASRLGERHQVLRRRRAHQRIHQAGAHHEDPAARDRPAARQGQARAGARSTRRWITSPRTPSRISRAPWSAYAEGIRLYRERASRTRARASTRRSSSTRPTVLRALHRALRALPRDASRPRLDGVWTMTSK
jgi:adenylate cyclase